MLDGAFYRANIRGAISVGGGPDSDHDDFAFSQSGDSISREGEMVT